MKPDLEAIRARDADYNDVFEAQASMSKDIAHRLVAWPVADRRALLAYVDELLAERALIVTRAENAERALVEADERHGRYVKAVGELAGMAARLAEAEALLDFCVQNLECGELHHEKHEYHKASDPCPVMARLHAFLGDKP